ncbi:MAG TPA: hypothetical protein ENJ20_02955 [Bacteroidetes bacterium]|nr:hypothetical protein [Bacteroidota bacterium]
MKNLLFLFLTLSTLTLISCGGCGSKTTGSSDTGNTSTTDKGNTDPASAGDEAPKNLTEAMEEAKKAMKEAGLKTDVKTINFRELQKLLPEKLAGMERISKSGETAGAMGMNFSTAKAKYKDDEGAVYEMEIIDTGGLGMGIMSMAAWSSVTIDKEDENGYERTTQLNGYKAYEKFRKNSGRAEVSVIPHNRFVVKGECRNCKIENLKKIIKEMELDELKDMAAEGES